MRINLGTRKLGLGGGGYNLTVPRAWVRTMKMVPGDRVCVVIDDDGSLKITPEGHA